MFVNIYCGNIFIEIGFQISLTHTQKPSEQQISIGPDSSFQTSLIVHDVLWPAYIEFEVTH